MSELQQNNVHTLRFWCFKCTIPKGECIWQASKLKRKCIILSLLELKVNRQFNLIHTQVTQHKHFVCVCVFLFFLFLFLYVINQTFYLVLKSYNYMYYQKKKKKKKSRIANESTYTHTNQPYATLMSVSPVRGVWRAKLKAHGLLLSIVNSDWLQHAHSSCMQCARTPFSNFYTFQQWSWPHYNTEIRGNVLFTNQNFSSNKSIQYTIFAYLPLQLNPQHIILQIGNIVIF